MFLDVCWTLNILAIVETLKAFDPAVTSNRNSASRVSWASAPSAAIARFSSITDIRMRYLGVATPTSTTVGVTRLAGPDFMIEIEAVAVVNS
jgi:enamine deaminase RidA (YjgF/YER057c/UK114 family)